MDGIGDREIGFLNSIGIGLATFFSKYLTIGVKVMPTTGATEWHYDK